MPLRRVLPVCLLAVGTSPVADASAFRGGSVVAKLGAMKVEDLRNVMLDELVTALGGGHRRLNEQRLQQIEEALRPTFEAMPKNEHGHLEHAAVRYALHRLFVQRHGMYIKGLEPGGQAWNSSSAAEVLEDRVPAFVQGLFEERLHGRGLGMVEMAALAATLEHLIHDEAVGRLETAYRAHGLPIDEPLSEHQAEDVLETYMVLFILGKNASKVSMEEVMQERATIQSVYPSWPESQKFAKDVRQSVIQAHRSDSAFAGGRLAFQGVSMVVEEIGERYGRWQDAECKDLKSALLKLERPGTGRVPLKDFYGNALGGQWQFTESVEYLRELGALDETDPKRMSVIIPNYINAPSNCLASSGLYSVCCINECEALLGEVERQVAQPEVEPSKIVEVVSRLPSATVPAPRQLPSQLVSLLDEVAQHHDGRVPLHGRLFAQWLHHAFPRECPFPHKSGTTKPMTADEWLQEEGGLAPSASEEEMQRHVTMHQETAEEASTSASTAAPERLMWTAEEELVVSRPARPSARPSAARAVLRFVACLGAAGAASAALFATLRSAMDGAGRAMGGSRRGKEELLPFSSKQHSL